MVVRLRQHYPTASINENMATMGSIGGVGLSNCGGGGEGGPPTCWMQLDRSIVCGNWPEQSWWVDLTNSTPASRTCAEMMLMAMVCPMFATAMPTAF